MFTFCSTFDNVWLTLVGQGWARLGWDMQLYNLSTIFSKAAILLSFFFLDYSFSAQFMVAFIV